MPALRTGGAELALDLPMPPDLTCRENESVSNSQLIAGTSQYLVLLKRGIFVITSIIFGIQCTVCWSLFCC